ncbi:SpoIIE family protein phosphatase [Streptomyces sp. C]|uniref:SpoIIE family protein phosphatase n=1 Tax=Streptomyces sp. C TaxID=253839 RepID=UPI0001B557B4|nr:SpoIIE family protein phosphatase [Streptomyces sp. C]EFL16134.1 predicted protein [Streptomyces sp. C]
MTVGAHGDPDRSESFGEQLLCTGRLQWVNAGHPAPMLIRDHRVVRRLNSPTILPSPSASAGPSRRLWRG